MLRRSFLSCLSYLPLSLGFLRKPEKKTSEEMIGVSYPYHNKTLLIKDGFVVCEIENWKNGRTHWVNAAGQFHREDGPAMIMADGSEIWYENGVVHRNDGPAITTPSGYQAWYQNGLRHRLYGPAIIRDNGDKEYWLHGKKVERNSSEWAFAVING